MNYLNGKCSSLKVKIGSVAWRHTVWKKAIKQAEDETPLEQSDFPKVCPWSMEQILASNFYPDEIE